MRIHQEDTKPDSLYRDKVEISQVPLEARNPMEQEKSTTPLSTMLMLFNVVPPILQCRRSIASILAKSRS